MFSLAIRYFSITICSILSYHNILNIHTRSWLYHLRNISFMFCLSCLTSVFPFPNSIFRLIFIGSIFLLYITFYTHTKFCVSLIVTLISFALSFISLSISSLLISIFIIICSVDISTTNTIVLTSIGLIQTAITFILFRIKRLRRGMPFLYQNSFLNIGITISIFIIFIFFILQFIRPTNIPNYLLILFLILFLALLLLIWWRRKITQSYVEKLRISEVEALYKEISDKDLEIEKLHVNNDELARIIHKDNKLIPAMELAVRNYLQAADSMTLEDVKQMGKDLLTHLERMSEDRQGIIHTYQEKTAYHQRCGLASIDAIVDYMEKRASDLGIEYHYQYDKDIKEKLSAYINETDAMHLLSDIIENAIIATTDQDKKMICVHIGFIQDILFMDISDSGIAFDPETYQNFGILKSTTHADHGGSGIGLMDLGRLKKQYKFSLQIYEYSPDSSDYTKKIRLLFDKKNHYLIQSYRAKEISSIVTRNDLHIFSSNNKEQRLFHI